MVPAGDARLMGEEAQTISQLMAERDERGEPQSSELGRLVRMAGEQMIGQFTMGLVQAELEGEESRDCQSVVEDAALVP